MSADHGPSIATLATSAFVMSEGLACDAVQVGEPATVSAAAVAMVAMAELSLNRVGEAGWSGRSTGDVVYDGSGVLGLVDDGELAVVRVVGEAGV